MKKLVLLTLLVFSTITSQGQWVVEPSTPMVESREYIRVTNEQGMRRILVTVVQKIPLSLGEWEGYGYDSDGNWYYLYHGRNTITIGRKLLGKPAHL